MLARILVVVGVLLALAGCADQKSGPWLIEGSTYRIGEPAQTGQKPDLKFHIFTTRLECRGALGEKDADLCVPQVDRATGQVRLSFRLLDRETQLAYDLPLGPDHIKVSHNKSPVTEGARRGVELIQHEPKRTGQLFILLIDGSGSMYDEDAAGEKAIDKVYRALLAPKVKEAFFPKEVATGVVLLRFTGRTPTGLDGGPPVVLESVEHYEEDVRSYLYSRDRGWTHLYDAVGYAIGPLMEEQSIKDWIGIHKAEPTILALTDGFNNEKGDDTCATNVPRLQGLLEELEVARNQPLGRRPTVFTIGLGRPIRKDFEVPSAKVTARDLCRTHKDDPINAYLERMGIDNVSLQWIAERGGGRSFVKRNQKGLAEVFQEAAAVRYGWYTVYYKVDKFHHRQSFETRIQLTSYANSEATVKIFPSAWLDAPSGNRPEGMRWTEPTPLRSSFALVMPILGVIVFLTFLGPASFNARRAVTRRARGGAKGQAQAPPAGAPPPPG